MSGHFRSKSLTVLLGLALTASTLAGCRSVPLASPPTTRAASTPERSREAIIAALILYRYVVDEESPGRLRARLQTNSWSMVVDIHYDHDYISVNYADSLGLKYEVKNDVPYIHENYNVRAEELTAEIKRQVMIAELKSRPMPTATPAPPH